MITVFLIMEICLAQFSSYEDQPLQLIKFHIVTNSTMLVFWNVKVYIVNPTPTWCQIKVDEIHAKSFQ